MSMSDKGRRGAAAAAVAAGASLGLAGTAGAATVPATLSLNHACYVTIGKTRPTMVVTGTGYVPGDTVSISDTTGTFIENVTASPTGTITASAPAPVTFFSRPGERRDTLTATDYAQDGNTYEGSAGTELSQMLAAARTRRGHGLRVLTFKTRWSFSGFAEGKEIWGHYLYHNKVVVRQKFGRAHGPCGLLTVRKRMYPARPHHRVYGIQLDSRRRYSKHTSPRLVSKIGLQLF
jgi:hypothetical protein